MSFNQPPPQPGFGGQSGYGGQGGQPQQPDRRRVWVAGAAPVAGSSAENRLRAQRVDGHALVTHFN
ncbi:hypothetical protein PV703_07805 [Streptomyces sp. ME01-24h]|nr:hypothetical protein [Streptomyces sp. ME01-24h]